MAKNFIDSRLMAGGISHLSQQWDHQANWSEYRATSTLWLFNIAMENPL